MQTGRAQRRRWLVATVATVVTLGAGTWWLLVTGTRGAEIATVLALSVAVLSLLVGVVAVVVALRGATDGTSSTAPVPKIGILRRGGSAARWWGALAGAAGLVGIVVVVLSMVARPGPGAAQGPTPNPSSTLPSHLHEVALPEAGSAPLDIAAATDGTAWFTEFENNKIGHLTADRTIQEFDRTSAGERLVHSPPPTPVRSGSPSGPMVWCGSPSSESAG